MIAFALIAIGCVPVAVDLIREILSIPNWAATPKATRRRIVREAGMTALCFLALIELGLRFVLRS